MLVLVLGGSGSGKSEFAEKVCMQLEPQEKLYIATMYPWDDESKRKISRHIELRKNKKFRTLECFYQMSKTLQSENVYATTVLLECMSNLLANEMYCEEGILSRYASKERQEQITNSKDKLEVLVQEIMSGIDILSNQYKHVVIVSNDVFSDGVEYDESMQEYLSALGQINQEIAKKADILAEVVCGIPIIRKGEVCYEKIME